MKVILVVYISGGVADATSHQIYISNLYPAISSVIVLKR